MKILITGSQGQLGWELLREAKSYGFETIGFDLPQIDITIKPDVEKVINNIRPDIVINAAGYTNVDRAEDEREVCFAANCTGPGNIAAVCNNLDIPMIHISTDYVFDGRKNTPYTEKDIISPINAYGKCKAEGDNAVSDVLQKHIIIRTSWLYGIHGNNFVKTILRLGKEKEVLEVVSDQYGSPTFVTDLADAVLTISSHIKNNSGDIWGIYNYCGAGVTTWHGFAEKIIEEAGKYLDIKTILVKPITSKEYPTKAGRPSYSALDCSLINRQFGIVSKPWQESLKMAIKLICSNA